MADALYRIKDTEQEFTNWDDTIGWCRDQVAGQEFIIEIRTTPWNPWHNLYRVEMRDIPILWHV